MGAGGLATCSNARSGIGVGDPSYNDFWQSLPVRKVSIRVAGVKLTGLGDAMRSGGRVASGHSFACVVNRWCVNDEPSISTARRRRHPNFRACWEAATVCRGPLSVFVPARLCAGLHACGRGRHKISGACLSMLIVESCQANAVANVTGLRATRGNHFSRPAIGTSYASNRSTTCAFLDQPAMAVPFKCGNLPSEVECVCTKIVCGTNGHYFVGPNIRAGFRPGRWEYRVESRWRQSSN